MPRMGGLEATRLMREQSKCRSTPILAMTANAFIEDKALCLEAGMNGFIVNGGTRGAFFCSTGVA